MMFDTAIYWLFFFSVMALMLAVRLLRTRALFLVAASFFFYGFWDVRFLVLLLVSMLANFILGLVVVDQRGNPSSKWLIVGITSNLIILGFFKYYNFFAQSFANLVGVPADHWAITIILPIGISFYTFEGIAYLVDIYWKHIAARKNVLDFALFISFFPHLVAGPIIRPESFFPQLDQGCEVSRADVRWSFIQIGKGLFKKGVFADSMAIVADAYFNGSQGTSAFIGLLAFTLQIYFVFSGYTDIARGCAQLLGFRFPTNFERPYLASNISEFWRRWHISLSGWLRDYLYIPLGGNRASRFARYRNYLVVMGLGGLWHGANWNFLIWGLYHGLLLLMHRVFLDFAPKRVMARLDNQIGHAAGVVLTASLVALGWIPFRAASFEKASEALKALLNGSGYQLMQIPPSVIAAVLVPAVFCAIDRGRRIQNWLAFQASLGVYLVMLGGLLWLTTIFSYRGNSIPFIYFQF